MKKNVVLLLALPLVMLVGCGEESLHLVQVQLKLLPKKQSITRLLSIQMEGVE